MKILSFGSLHQDSTGNSTAASGRVTGDKLKMTQKCLLSSLGIQLALAWRDWGKPQNALLRKAYDLAEIWTRCLPK